MIPTLTEQESTLVVSHCNYQQQEGGAWAVKEKDDEESLHSNKSNDDDGTESTAESHSSDHSEEDCSSSTAADPPVSASVQASEEVTKTNKMLSFVSISDSLSSSPEDTVVQDGSEAFAAAKAMSMSQQQQQQQMSSSRRSILKMSSLREEIPVVSKRFSWKQLPEPDMNKIRHSVSLPLELDDFAKPHNKKTLQVSFREVNIREFDQTIGDNPSCSYGPPISLDWKFEELEPVTIDDYENLRGTLRVRKNMALSYYQRMAILQNMFGHTEEELKKAHKEADRGKLKRAVTKAFLPAQKVEEVFQSAGRKTKRYLGRRRRHSTAI